MLELTDELSRSLDEAATLILRSNHVVALAGAGLSVESGIPPYRGPGGTEVIKAKYPEKTLLICADNDVRTDGNPGVEAAKAVSARFDIAWIYPELGGTKCD